MLVTRRAPYFYVRVQKGNMGLAQQFRFSYNDGSDLEAFMNDLKEEYSVTRQSNGLYVIKPIEGNGSFVFEAAIEDYGLYTHRSGNYFTFVGILVERLTAIFGRLEIEDEWTLTLRSKGRAKSGAPLSSTLGINNRAT